MKRMVLGFGTSVLICTAFVCARASSTQAQGANETNASQRPGNPLRSLVASMIQILARPQLARCYGTQEFLA